MRHNLIIDGSNLMMSGISMNTADFLDNSMYVGGVTSVLRSISKLKYRLTPDYIYIVFDRDKSDYRLSLLPTYKGNRKLAKDVKYRASFNSIAREILEDILPNMGVYLIDYCDGIEADDVITNFVKQSNNHNTIVSTDSDYIQLINNNTSIYNQVQELFLSVDNIDEYLGFNCKFYANFKSLQGDTSDNIKGVHLVGKERAKEIINQCGIETCSLLSYASQFKSKWARNLEVFINDTLYDFNLKLIDLQYSPYIDIKTKLKQPKFDIDYVRTKLERLEFTDIILHYDWQYLLDWSYDLHNEHQSRR